MGLAAGCGVANNEAGNDRNNLTPVGYDNNTRYAPLYVTDPTETPVDDNNAGINDGTKEYSPDPALNQDEANDGDGDETDTNTGTDNGTNGTPSETTTDNGTTNTGTDTNNNEETPGTDTNTENNTGTDNDTPNPEANERTETQTPTLGGNVTIFSDVPKDSGYYNDIHEARKLNLMNGTDLEKNLFGYKQAITREQMASILMKAYRAGYISGITTNDKTENNTSTNNTGTNNTETNNETTGTNNNTGTNNTNNTNNNTTGTTGAGQ